MPACSTRRAWYTRGWNVIEKIRRAKEQGTLADTFGDESCEFCGQTLCRDQADILSPVCPIEELTRLRRRVMVLELLITPGVSQLNRSSGTPCTLQASVIPPSNAAIGISRIRANSK